MSEAKPQPLKDRLVELNNRKKEVETAYTRLLGAIDMCTALMEEEKELAKSNKKASKKKG